MLQEMVAECLKYEVIKKDIQDYLKSTGVMLKARKSQLEGTPIWLKMGQSEYQEDCNGLKYTKYVKFLTLYQF